MPKNISKELEREILALPVTEKNKMLLRLISKKQLLLDQLQYKLLENEEVYLLERRNELREKIRNNTGQLFNGIQNLFSRLKALYTEVVYHRKVTGDKYGEAELSIFLFLTFFKTQATLLTGTRMTRYHEKPALFFVKKTLGVLAVIEKLHEDYRLEFNTDLEELSAFLYDSISRQFAEEFRIPKQF